jgi:hypothetical protein
MRTRTHTHTHTHVHVQKTQNSKRKGDKCARAQEEVREKRAECTPNNNNNHTKTTTTTAAATTAITTTASSIVQKLRTKECEQSHCRQTRSTTASNKQRTTNDKQQKSVNGASKSGSRHIAETIKNKQQQHQQATTATDNTRKCIREWEQARCRNDQLLRQRCGSPPTAAVIWHASTLRQERG